MVEAKELFLKSKSLASRYCLAFDYSPLRNNRGGVGGSTDNVNINKGRPNKRSGDEGKESENCSRSKVAARYH